MFQLDFASGSLLLPGKDVDQVFPTRWRLKVDLMQLIEQRRVKGTCRLQLTADARSYASLTCSGSITPEGERFHVSWSAPASYRHASPA